MKKNIKRLKKKGSEQNGFRKLLWHLNHFHVSKFGRKRRRDFRRKGLAANAWRQEALFGPRGDRQQFEA